MAFCTNCGAQMNDGQQFCTSCGTKVAAAAPVAEPTPAAQAPVYQAAPAAKESTWDGGVLDTIVNSIIASLIMSITCGIGTPWALCYIFRFITEHSIVDGKRMKFTGTGGGLFAQWIKWFLLTVITCGIYSFWVTPRLYKWIVSHIHEA